VAIRGFAALAQLAVAEIETVTASRPNQEAEADGTALVPCPDDAIALVVLEHRRLACLSFGIGKSETVEIEPGRTPYSPPDQGRLAQVGRT
jgi:hypothetical protein